MIKINDKMKTGKASQDLWETSIPVQVAEECELTSTIAQLDRRQFVGAAAVAGIFASLGLAGCAPREKTGAGGTATLAPGTYIAQSQGRNGTITVQATFGTSGLTNIECDHMESRNIGDTAITLMTERYVTSQSLNIDTVSGATLSSMAFATAVASCYEQAGGDVASLKNKDNGFEPAPAIDETCDVVVIGTGGAALAAAVTAAEAGRQVVMLEKMDIVGGNTNAGEGTLNAPDPERQAPLGIEDSADKYYEDTFVGGDSAGDPALVRVLADNALDAVHWMEAHGLEYEPEVFTAIGGLWQRGHAVEVEVRGEQGGSYYVSCLRDAAERLGVKIYTDAKVEKLIKDGDTVTGVSGLRPSSGSTVSVHAKSAIIATGGYARNTELAMQYDKRVTPTMPTSNVSSSTGDGLIFGQDAGAGVRNMELVQIHPLGDPQNGGVATFVGNWLGVEDYIFVNNNGLRFIREDERRDTIANAILEQPGDAMWLMVDATDVTADRLEQIADLVSKGHSFEADSLAGLAAQIDVPADALEQTIESYNKAVRSGVDEAQGKLLLGDEFVDAPLYASKRIPTIHYCMGGLTITPEAKVTANDGTIIPGLFAAGEVCGGVQGTNRLGGNSFTDLIVFGRIAGASAAANV